MFERTVKPSKDLLRYLEDIELRCGSTGTR
jgi:hypothetical protein